MSREAWQKSEFVGTAAQSRADRQEAWISDQKTFDYE